MACSAANPGAPALVIREDGTLLNKTISELESRIATLVAEQIQGIGANVNGGTVTLQSHGLGRPAVGGQRRQPGVRGTQIV